MQAVLLLKGTLLRNSRLAKIQFCLRVDSPWVQTSTFMFHSSCHERMAAMRRQMEWMQKKMAEYRAAEEHVSG